MKNHKFGIIGLGMIADFHAKAIAALENAELVACCSRDSKKAENFAHKNDCQAFTDLDEMLKSGIDILNICTPSGLHNETAIAAAKAGIHVICEKPLEISLERLDAMTQAHKEAGTALSGIFPYRFNDVTVEMKKAAESARYGRMVFGGAYVPWFRDQAYYDEGGWKGTIKYDGGGALMNQSIHAIDSLIWIMGDIESVSAFSATLAHENIEVEDTAVASVKFKNGALGLIMGTTSIYPGGFRRLEICGDRGTAVCTEEDLTTWSFKDETDSDAELREKYTAVTSSGGGASDPSAISFEGHRRNIESFLDALENHKKQPIDGAEARKSVEVILAIYESAAKGKTITINH